VEKCVRKMCLYLMVQEKEVIYTLFRNSVPGVCRLLYRLETAAETMIL
jgi:hypothetical protein